MMKLVEAVERWGDDFEERYIYQSPTGPLYPKVNIGAIEGGAPYRPVFFAGRCSIYVDVRIPPKLRPVTVQQELEEVLNGAGVDYELQAYHSLLGHEGVGVEPLVGSVQEVYQHLFGKPIRPEEPARASIWTDTNVYNELGVPAVKVGPKGWRPTPRVEEIRIDEVLHAAQIYALVALDICNRERA
jgi:acetylornithine deacetylase/succinyl-diaminopimelate desuccinylase-like protein